MREYDRGYIAGLIDGDGSITLHGSKWKSRNAEGIKYQVIVFITSSHRGFLEDIAREYSDSVDRVEEANTTRGQFIFRKPIWRYYMPISAVRKLLPKIRLKLKEERRLIAVEALKILNGRWHRQTTEEKARLKVLHEKMKSLQDKATRKNGRMR